MLALELDGRSITGAKLLKYPQSREAGAAPVVLFDDSAASDFVARTGWIGADGMPLQMRMNTDINGAAATMTMRYSRINDPRHHRSQRLGPGHRAIQILIPHNRIPPPVQS